MTTIVAEALRKLTNEVDGLWWRKSAILEAIGNANWQILTQRASEAHAALARFSKQPVPVTSKPGWDGRQYAEARGDYPLEVEDDKPGRAM